MGGFVVAVAGECYIVIAVAVVYFSAVGVWQEAVLGVVPAADAFVEGEFIGGDTVIGDIRHVVLRGVSLAGEGDGFVVLGASFHLNLSALSGVTVEKCGDRFLAL